MRFPRITRSWSAAVSVIFASLLFLLLSAPLGFSTGNEEQDYSRQLVIASSNNFPPMNMLDADGNLIGFGRELSQAVVSSMGIKPVHVHSHIWSDVLGLLNKGAADLIHDTGYTEERDKYLDYTDPIIEMPEVIFVRSDRFDITGFKSLRNQRVGCVRNHITHLYLKQFPEIKCVIAETPIQGVFDLISRKTDAFIYPKQIVLYLTQDLRIEDKIKLTGEPLRTLSWSMVVKEGNHEVLALLNQGLAKVHETGEYQRIYNKWFGQRLLFGYSIKDLIVISVTLSGSVVSLVLLFGFYIFNRSLNRSKKKLKAANLELLSEISDRKTAEVRLRESEERLHLLAENVEEVFWIVSPDWQKVLYISPAYEKIWGLSTDSLEASAFTWLDMVVEEDKEKVRRFLEEKIQGDWSEISFPEYRIQKPDGSIRWIYARGEPVRDELGAVQKVVGIAADITKRKETEQALKQSEEEYRKLVESTNSIILKYGLDSKLTFVNHYALKFFGYTKEEMLGKYAVGTHVPAVETAGRNLVDIMAEILKDPEVTVDFENENFTRSGKKVWVSWRNKGIFDEQGNLIELLCMGYDVTELRKVQEKLQKTLGELEKQVELRTLELKKAVEEAEQANIAKSEFLANISHELRNPMHHILSYAKYGIDKIDRPKEKLLHYFYQTRKSAERLMVLLNDLLDLSKMESGRMDYVMKSHNLFQIAREAVSEFSPAMDDKNLTIEFVDSQIRTQVLCDYFKIGQVMRNLLGNAIKFTPANKRIEIRFSRHNPIGNETGKAAIQVSVHDRGIGIPEDELSFVFNKFTQSSKTKTGAGGTGLGLAICKEIIKAHAGTIWAQNNSEGGATFSFLLPCDE